MECADWLTPRARGTISFILHTLIQKGGLPNTGRMLRGYIIRYLIQEVREGFQEEEESRLRPKE